MIHSFEHFGVAYIGFDDDMSPVYSDTGEFVNNDVLGNEDRGVGGTNVFDSNILANVLTEIALKISERATYLAKHAGRKTIKADDIKLASKEI